MGAFSIVLGGHAAESAACPDGHLAGRLMIGDFVEGFCSSLSYWSPTHYRAHWRRSLSHIATLDQSRSALITNALDPTVANFLTWWMLYRSGDQVRIANGLVSADDHDLAQVLENPSAVMGPPEEVWSGPPEERASEWETSVADIEEHLRT